MSNIEAPIATRSAGARQMEIVHARHTCLVQTDLPTLLRAADGLKRRWQGDALPFTPTRYVLAGEHDAGWFAYHGAGSEEGIDQRFLPTTADMIHHPNPDCGALHLIVPPDLGWSLARFEAVLQDLYHVMPGVQVRGFSARSVWQLSLGERLPVATVLGRLREAGLALLAGSVAPTPGFDWRAIHQAAHVAGVRSMLAVLFRASATDAERLADLEDVCGLQERTGGVEAIVPLFSQQAPVEERQRWVALTRLVLPRVPHVVSRWDSAGLDDALAALHAGADILDGPLAPDGWHSPSAALVWSRLASDLAHGL